MEVMQSTFRCIIEKGSLAATPASPNNIGTFQSFSVITEQFADENEIDCDDFFASIPDLQQSLPEPDTSAGPGSSDSDSDVEDIIWDINFDGASSQSAERGLSMHPPPSGPLKGYEYTSFEPKNIPRELHGHTRASPTQSEASSAIQDLSLITQPKRKTGRGYQDPDLDLWTQARLEGMKSMLFMYTNTLSNTYDNWGASSCQAAIGMGRGPSCACRLRRLCRAYLADRKVFPVNPYGEWNMSMLVDETLQNEIGIYLLSIGKDISAKKLMDFLHQPDIKEKYAIERDISHKTACRYLHTLGFHYKATPKGQYADGHEREDVVLYWQNIFLPQWRQIQDQMVSWDIKLVESPPRNPGRRAITWFHDESVFYAHDRRKKGWYHKDAPARPYTKGEGASLMIADFVSADFGWLKSPDGKKSARRTFKPGKNCDGYFSNEDIQEQANLAMDILLEYYPQFDHFFIYDNATTHLKREDDTISARKMPKNIPKEGTNWGIEVTKRDSTTGKPVCKPDGTHEKIKIRMKDGQLLNGQQQPFYFPEGHPRAGVFKGMAVILEERGFGDMSKKRAQCKNFACAPGEVDCCCRRMLYMQPDFANIDSILQTVAAERGFRVLFLPKFHCELNFIEQCWGCAKNVYRTYPESSREDRLEQNAISALDSISLAMMRKFSNRSLRFMNAYDCGLNGRQAAWASRKYRGHRVLPNDIMEELGENGIL
jgi:hypothetical protein